VEIAAAASVPRVVLTHHLPGAVPVVKHSGYTGEVIVGNDLDAIDI
jgi:hypothetical protein